MQGTVPTTYPIDHWSYSAMMQFLRNPLGFKKRYIMKIYDQKISVSGLVGKAAHKALERFYNGASVHDATAIGLDFLNRISDSDVEWGKTGSREKAIKMFTQGLNFYFAEAPKYDDILGVEKSITAFIEVDGQKLALPAKAVSDLIVRNKKAEIDIIDYKFVSSHTDGETDKASHIIQSLFNYYTVKQEFGITPKRMIFEEVKLSQSKDGSPQLQPYVIEYEQQQEYFALFHKLYDECTRELSRPDKVFLPNFDDRFDGETLNDYRKEIVTTAAPVLVNHKTQHKQFAEKKYVSSETNLVDNEFLSAEEKIKMKLQEFGIAVKMEDTYNGASVTQYTFQPSRGVKMSTIASLAKDLAITLKAKTIRVQAPIMGTNLVGVEVPNINRKIVHFSTATLEPGTLTIPIGINVYGATVTKKLDEMPHLLVAGATGSGKSVFLNVAIRSLIEQNSPDLLKLILIDPKRVELSQFKSAPHLLAPVIYDEDKANITLNWLLEEMELRYQRLELAGVRNVDEFNTNTAEQMQKIVLVIDEFADLMLQTQAMHPVKQPRTRKKTGKKATMRPQVAVISSENAIVRLAQKSRAVGIHLILGTQRPSVDVVTGLIKANLPTRVAFMTTSLTDSQIILDANGAEELIGKGDMLFLDPHVRGLQRLQGFYL